MSKENTVLTDKLVEFIVNATRAEERVKQEKLEEQRSRDHSIPRGYNQFWAERKAGDLVGPAQTCAAHHRKREEHYVNKLAEAEKELREKGVSVEVFDSSTGTYSQFQNTLASGNIQGQTANFQPRVDQKLMDHVKNAKDKMLEHREKASTYEKQARAFALNPDFGVRLSIEDIHYFRLES